MKVNTKIKPDKTKESIREFNTNLNNNKENSKIYLEAKSKSHINGNTNISKKRRQKQKSNIVCRIDFNNNSKNKENLFNISSSNYINDLNTISSKSTSLHFFSGIKKNLCSNNYSRSNIHPNVQSNSDFSSKNAIKSINEYFQEKSHILQNNISLEIENKSPNKILPKNLNSEIDGCLKNENRQNLNVKKNYLKKERDNKQQNCSPNLKGFRNDYNIPYKTQSNSNNKINNDIKLNLRSANVITKKITDLNKDFIKMKLNKSISITANKNKKKSDLNIINYNKVKINKIEDSANKVTEFRFDSNNQFIDDINCEKFNRDNLLSDNYNQSKENILLFRGLSHNTNLNSCNSKVKLENKINNNIIKKDLDYEFCSSSANLMLKINSSNDENLLDELNDKINKPMIIPDNNIIQNKKKSKKCRLGLDNLLKLVKSNKNSELIKEKLKNHKSKNAIKNEVRIQNNNNITYNKTKNEITSSVINIPINTDENKENDHKELINFDLKLINLDFTKLIKTVNKNKSRPNEAEDVSIVSSSKKIFKKLYHNDTNTINSNLKAKNSNNTMDINIKTVKNIVESDYLEKMQLNLEEINKIINPKNNRNKLSYFCDVNNTNHECKNTKISKLQIIDNIINGLSDLKKIVNNEELLHEERSTIKSNLVSKYTQKVKNKGFNLSILENEDNINDCSNVFNKNIIAEGNKSLIFTPIKVVNEDLYNLYDFENLVKEREFYYDQNTNTRNLRIVSKHKSSDDIFRSMFNNKERDRCREKIAGNKFKIGERQNKRIRNLNDRKIENVFKHNLLGSNESNSLLYYSKLMCDSPNRSNHTGGNNKDLRLKDILLDVKYDLNDEFNNVSINLQETIEVNEISYNNSSKSDLQTKNDIYQSIINNGIKISKLKSSEIDTNEKSKNESLKNNKKASTGEFSHSYCIENQSSSNSKIVNSSIKTDINFDKNKNKNLENVDEEFDLKNCKVNLNKLKLPDSSENKICSGLAKLTRNNKNKSIFNNTSFNSPIYQNSAKFLKMKDFLSSQEIKSTQVKMTYNLKKETKENVCLRPNSYKKNCKNKIQYNNVNQDSCVFKENTDNSIKKIRILNENPIKNIESNVNKSKDKNEYKVRHSIDKGNLNFINFPGSAYFTLFTPHNNDNCNKMVFDNKDSKDKFLNLNNMNNKGNEIIENSKIKGKNNNNSRINNKSIFSKSDLKFLDVKNSNIEFIKNLVNINAENEYFNTKNKLKGGSMNINSCFNKKS